MVNQVSLVLAEGSNSNPAGQTPSVHTVGGTALPTRLGQSEPHGVPFGLPHILEKLGLLSSLKAVAADDLPIL